MPAESTAVVVALPSGRIVFSRNADVALEPASNEKLGVTYAALVELGASYRFPTEVLGEGRRVGGTWHGRLILKGFGDPALTSSDLKRLVGIVGRLGIRHVTGGSPPPSVLATSASRCLRCSGTNVVGNGNVSAASPNDTSAGT